jgi:hypothetical protein
LIHKAFAVESAALEVEFFDWKPTGKEVEINAKYETTG